MWFSWSPDSGTGNSVVIGRLCTIWMSLPARHHSMSWGRPKCASIRRPSCASRIGEDHLLHDHGHVDCTVVDAPAMPVGHGALGEQRGPAPADLPEDRR